MSPRDLLWMLLFWNLLWFLAALDLWWIFPNYCVCFWDFSGLLVEISEVFFFLFYLPISVSWSFSAFESSLACGIVVKFLKPWPTSCWVKAPQREYKRQHKLIKEQLYSPMISLQHVWGLSTCQQASALSNLASIFQVFLTPAQAQALPTPTAEPHLPAPQSVNGNLGGSHGFLTQCSCTFKLQALFLPFSFQRLHTASSPPPKESTILGHSHLGGSGSPCFNYQALQRHYVKEVGVWPSMPLLCIQ